jgi:hypothetical protein
MVKRRKGCSTLSNSSHEAAAFIQQTITLQQDERVKKGTTMCPTCSSNIGCHMCANFDKCITGEQLKYRRECVSHDDRFCGKCNHYICPEGSMPRLPTKILASSLRISPNIFPLTESYQTVWAIE